MGMVQIKKIKVNKKEYLITILRLGGRIRQEGYWYTAYVYLNNPNLKEQDLHHCTFHVKNTYGVDTDHYYNEEMTLEEKFKDAMFQIKELIKSSQKKDDN